MASHQAQALSLALAVRGLVRAVDRYRASVARQLGASSTEIVALGHLYVDGSLTVSELAGELGMTTAAATEMVDRLEKIGFAQRQPHPTDRRKRLVEISPEGEQAAKAFYADLGSQLRVVYTSLTQSQQRGVDRFLRQVPATLADPHF